MKKEMERIGYQTLFLLLVLIALTNLVPAVALANPPFPTPEPKPGVLPPIDPTAVKTLKFKPVDQPNVRDYQRNQARQRLLEAGDTARAGILGLSGNDRVLVILVEFAGTDTFTWNAPTNPADYTTGSMWDPLGKADPNEAVLNPDGTVQQGNCSKIITQTTTFTYTGPLHNQIPRPVSATDPSGTLIWTTDFSPDWFRGFMFGNGVVFNYNRTDGSSVYADFTGKSVAKYYQEFSSGAYNITGDVIGWLQLPHSTWWYGADRCPGNRSGMTSGAGSDSGIPGAGTTKSLVRDALDAVNAISPTIAGFNWKNYDLNGDGIIDRLWIVHAGYDETDYPPLLNRTDYGEASLWAHSSALTPAYPVSPDVKAGPYIMMPETGGIGVFAHEYGHNLGAQDLFPYGFGWTSVGFWTLMADGWTGFPIGFQPPALDPYHLDNWGWLNPRVIVDPNQVYTVQLGQASNFPGGTGTYRGVKIQLPNGAAPLPVQPWQGSYYWWGGKQDLANGMMTTKNTIALTGGTAATLSFDLVYGIEDQYDFLWVQVSTNGGTSWTTLTNANTKCTHATDWIGGLYGFPDDLCAAGIGGFTGYNPTWPAAQSQTFDLTPYIGQNILLRFWYMTDWGATYLGPLVDNVLVTVDSTTKFSDNAESGDANWNYATPWQRSNGTQAFTHNYYLQWRNVASNGGYDSALGDSRWWFGPANTGLLVWYNNNLYNDNEVYNYLQDWPSFGPKGRMLVVDSHADPYRDPDRAVNYPNAISNLPSRFQMRDAPFGLNDTVSFLWPSLDTASKINTYAGRSAVSFFDDLLGYYPGIEFARRGTLPCTSNQWYDKMWDVSAVVPATGFYSTKATGGTGFTTGTGIRMMGFVNPAGACQASWYGNWYVPYADATNTGNPGDSNVGYGWHVQVVSQSADGTTATVKIWNTHYTGALIPNSTTAKINDVLTYRYALPGNQGSGTSLFACINLDTTNTTYVASSVTGGATPLSDTCSNVAGAVARDKPLAQLASRAPNATVAIGWTGYVDHLASVNFTYNVTVKTLTGTINQDVLLYKDGTLWRTLPAPPVRITAAYINWLPWIAR